MRLENFIIESGNSDDKTLNRSYKKFLIKVINNADDDLLERWETYNMIMEELVHLSYYDTFNEIKYRVTDGEDVNQVVLDVLSNIEKSNMLHFMQRNVERFIEDDRYSRFFLTGCLK